jgi:hypothetical protein
MHAGLPRCLLHIDKRSFLFINLQLNLRHTLQLPGL